MSETVFITGASRGIGRATALAFAKEGYKVGFCCRDSLSDARSLIEELRDIGAMCAFIQGDVASMGDVERMAGETREKLGPARVLINNAGISLSGLLHEMPPEKWERLWSVNVTGAYNATKCFLPQMLAMGEGSIINVSSVWGVYGASCEAAYSAGKAALIGMTKALSKELGPGGIRVNAVAPGVIRTDMNSGYSEEELAALCDATPLARMGEAEEVASALVFLASPAASFITGQVLGVDGGFMG